MANFALFFVCVLSSLYLISCFLRNTLLCAGCTWVCCSNTHGRKILHTASESSTGDCLSVSLLLCLTHSV